MPRKPSAYCPSCRKTEVFDVQEKISVKTKTGAQRMITRGACSSCKSTVFKITK